jgi:hypothetical protein
MASMIPYQMLIKFDKANTMMNVRNSPNNKISMFNDTIIGLKKRPLARSIYLNSITNTNTSTNSNTDTNTNTDADIGSNISSINTDGLVYYIDTTDTRSYTGSTTLADITPYFNTDKSTSYGTATIVGSPTSVSDEYVGTYLTFNGSTQYIIGADMIDSFQSPNNDNLTIQTWVRTNSTSAGVIATEQGTLPSGTTLNQGWHDSQQEIVNGDLYQGIWSYPVGTLQGVSSHTVIPNVWQMYTLTYNDSTNLLSSYVNGKLVATRTLNRFSPMENNMSVYYYALMAGDSTNMGDGTSLEGDWASFKVYNRAITQTEVSNNYIYDASNHFGFEYPPTNLSVNASVDGLTNTTTVSDEIYGNGSYTIKTSSSYSGTSYGYYIFNKNISSSDYWHSAIEYNQTTGVYEGTNSFNGISGEWVQIKLPNQINLKEFIIYPRYSTPIRAQDRSPHTFRLLGSTNGTSWDTISSYSNLVWDSTTNNGTKRFDLQNNTSYYSYYTIVVEIVGNSTYPDGTSFSRNSVQICEWVLIGKNTDL